MIILDLISFKTGNLATFSFILSGLISLLSSRLNIKLPSKSENISICPKLGKIWFAGNLLMKNSLIKASYPVSIVFTFNNKSKNVSAEKEDSLILPLFNNFK